MSKFCKNIFFDFLFSSLSILEVVVLKEFKYNFFSFVVKILSSTIEFKKFIEINAHLAILANGKVP